MLHGVDDWRVLDVDHWLRKLKILEAGRVRSRVIKTVRYRYTQLQLILFVLDSFDLLLELLDLVTRVSCRARRLPPELALVHGVLRRFLVEYRFFIALPIRII